MWDVEVRMSDGLGHMLKGGCRRLDAEGRRLGVEIRLLEIDCHISGGDELTFIFY